ncbi:hypothetical protein [Rudanella lutea]|uniref:hypothetical protein n=1 Tax=Rudanella lutea TaxID=451374 RepID=UPI000368B81E|nr:hypothetical protein [Rudanella lutea]
MPKRSDFLTLLCILTFMSCGIGLIDSATSYTRTADVARTQRIERPRVVDPNKPPEYFEDRSNSDDPIPGDPEEIRPLAASSFVYNLITLIGAVLMFFGRRLGFFVYVAGVLVGIIAPIALLGFSALHTSFGVFFSLIFVGLYAYSWKELR